MGKSKKKTQSTENSTTELMDTSSTKPDDSDEDLIDYLIENDNLPDNQIDMDEVTHSERSDNEDEASSSEDEENHYNGRVLNRKEYFERIYVKYAKGLYSSDKEKVAKSLRKKTKVVLGEGKEKNLVFVNDEPLEIEQRVQLNNKETIALQLTKTRLGFSYFCSYYDDRFDRICFQPFKDKKEVVDHYYSLHLNKLKNYYCNDENCRKSYVFHKQMKGHLIRAHGITTDFQQHYTPISYRFEARCRVKSIKDKDSMRLYQDRLIEKP